MAIVSDEAVYPDEFEEVVSKLPDHLKRIYISSSAKEGEAPDAPPSTMPVGSPGEPAGALESQPGTGVAKYETPLDTAQEGQFQAWKAQNAPQDSGFDYDLRGAFKAGIQPDPVSGHWPDTYKKPNHPTFSDQSQYAKDAPEKAGRWVGDQYFPPGSAAASILDNISFSAAGRALNKGIDAVTGAVANLPETLVNLPEHVGKQLLETGKLPGDVKAGLIDPGSTQGIEKAVNLATMMVAGPGIVPEKIMAKAADGTLGSFMGVRSKTFNQAAATKAKAMEDAAAHPDEIHHATGTHRGADGIVRQEIDDSGMSLKGNAFDHTVKQTAGQDGLRLGEHQVTIKDPTKFDETLNLNTKKGMDEWEKALKAEPGIPLDQVINHPKLFKAYPELAKIKVKELPSELNPDDASLAMLWKGAIWLKPGLHPEVVKSVIIHELQHSIQGIEGFARGGAPEMFASPKLAPAEELLKKTTREEFQAMLDAGMTKEKLGIILNTVEQHLEGKIDAMTYKVFEQAQDPDVIRKLVNLTKADKLLQAAKKEHIAMYRALAGEVEARNVQARINYNAMQRRDIPPERMENPPRNEQVLSPDDYENQHAQRAVTTFRRGANDNIKGLYNPREPNMIGDNAIDDAIDSQWKEFIAKDKRSLEITDEIGKMLNRAQGRAWTEI